MKITNQSERDDGFKKVAGIAAGATAAAILFKKTGLRKFASEASRAFKFANKDIGKEMATRSLRDLDYKTIKKIYNKNISSEGSNFQKAFDQKRKIEIGGNSKLSKDLKDLDAFNAQRNSRIEEMKASYIKTRILNKVHSKLGKKDDVMHKKVNQVVSNVLDNKNRHIVSLEDNEWGVLPTSIAEMLKGTPIEKDTAKIISTIGDEYTAIRNSNILQGIEDKYINKTAPEINATINDAIINKNKDSKNFFDDSIERAATVQDLLDAKANGKEFDEEAESIIKRVTEFKNANKGNTDIDSMIVSDDLRVFKGEIYSGKSFEDSMSYMKEDLADTIPGKLFGARSFLDKKKAPGVHFFGKSSYDANLAALTGSEDGLINDDHFYIMGKMYKVNEKGGLTHNPDLDDMELISGVHGVFNVLNERLHGNFQYRENSNKLLDIFSINTTGTNLLDSFKSRFSKFEDQSKNWNRTRLNKLIDGEFSAINVADGSMAEAAKELSKMLGDTMRAPTLKEAKALTEVLRNKDAIKIMKAFDQDNPIEYLMKNDMQGVSGNLEAIMRGYEKDKRYVNNLVKIGNMSGMKGLNVLHGNEIVRREILKSAMMTESMVGDVGKYAVTAEKISAVNVNDASKQYLDRMLHWTHLEDSAKLDTTSMLGELTLGSMEMRNEGISKMFGLSSSNAQNEYYINNFTNDLKNVVKENTSFFGSEKINRPESINGYRTGKWAAIKKSRGINVNQIIEDINNYTKTEGMNIGETDTARFLKQFVASRKNPEDITLGTLLPFHMLNRLVTPMDKFGLGFDPRQTSSVGALAANIMLKRVAPIAIGATALSYLNFEAEKTTGTSFGQAFENTKANTVLGVKQLQSTLGIDADIKRNRMNNPVTDYLFGEYKNEEEYLDYLEYGSDPVRKGRYWSFGSTSEFRGGKIAYWEPNKLRQAHSNYKDISLYGSSEEKWSRSLMPSLRYPLSPLKYLTNPYWIEDLNYDDRPYPVSGKMFAEGTPWGSLLNPTIGAIIKPQKRMHREDMAGLNDSRSIINDINLAIKDNAAEGSVARMDDTGVTPIGLSPKGMPSLDGAIMSMKVSEGNITMTGVRGADFAENLIGIEYASMPMKGGLGNTRYENIMPSGKPDDDVVAGLLGTMNTESYNYGDRVDPNVIIAKLNNTIKYAGNVLDVATTERARLAFTPHREAADNAEKKYLKSLNLNSQGDSLLNISSSAKELSGMYGFMFEQIMPNKRGYRLAEAGDMNSFARGFWDENIGGMGGDFMEIARRFFPHENHNLQSVNPLRNTQPLWMPERFWNGDPYTSLPKGEARLPGKGYESLNTLHSDKYGKYGAYDRFKILADISPGSEEYKIWKKIAKEEVRDPDLKAQMNMIEEQVAEQTKEHDFHDYRFLTKKMTNQKAVINVVNKDGTFTVAGDDQIYGIAGLDVDGRENTFLDYVKGGMEVTLRYEDNDYNKFRNPDPWKPYAPLPIAAIIDYNGENIGAKMFDDNVTKEIPDAEKSTLADKIFTAKQQDITMGHMWEAIGHARIPYFHNKLLRINSPMETYKHEQVYGTSYATWDHPIKGFIAPAFRDAWSKGPVAQAVGVGTWALSEWVRTTDLDNGIKKAAHGIFAMTNPAAFAGGLMGGLPRMSLGSQNGLINSKNGARVGALVGLGGYAVSHLENPLTSMLNFGVLGAAAMNQLKPEVGKGAVKEVLDTKYGAIAGVVLGLGLSTLKNPDFKLSNLEETYIPDDTKKKWDIEEYFDRMNYIKYDALYRKSARRAQDKEGIDLEKMFNIYEYNREKNKRKREELEEIKIRTAKMITDPGEREKYIQEANLKIEKLETPEQYFSLGEEAKNAIAHKKARDTTIFGLTEFSSTSDILRALPKYDRDFFLEFAKEKDPEERKEILKYVSPFKAKALKAMWGEEVENKESNANYFGSHALPGIFWGGWKPDIDMDDVKMKTIENEGMLLSDFGMYESAKYEPAAQNAPEINGYRDQGNALAVQASIQGMLGGIGLVGVNVSVDSGASKGIEVIANVINAGTQRVTSAGNSFLNLFI